MINLHTQLKKTHKFTETPIFVVIKNFWIKKVRNEGLFTVMVDNRGNPRLEVFNYIWDRSYIVLGMSLWLCEWGIFWHECDYYI
jgi:hypothetical protein